MSIGIARGNSYYPPHHDPQDWERDVRLMAAAGFNAIRTGELLASWDQIERFPRQPDFSWLAVRHRFGAGHAVYIGTHLDIAAFGSAPHHRVFAALLAGLGIEPPVAIRGEGSDLVDPHLLAAPDGTHLLIITNENQVPVEITACIPSIRATTVEELFGLPVALQRADRFAVTMRLPAEDAAVLRIR